MGYWSDVYLPNLHNLMLIRVAGGIFSNPKPQFWVNFGGP
jgi:hypothetical protein